MPRVATIEDSKGLRDVKVEEAERWQGPLLIVDAIDEGRKCEHKGPATLLVQQSGRYGEKGPLPAKHCSRNEDLSFL